MATTKKTVLITGSTRGIGLAFAQHYVKSGWNVIGTARANSNTERLAALEPFKIVTLDTSDEASIIEAAHQLEGVAIDLLINNAGVGIPGELLSTTKDAMMRQFEVNTIGPFLVTRALLPNLHLAAKLHGTAFVVQLASLIGSIGNLTAETAPMFKDAIYGYGSSKAAVNMIARALSVELKASNIVVVSVHPGYVDTEMTQGKGVVKSTDSVKSMTDFITKLAPEHSGKFFNLDPEIPSGPSVAELPW
ncbi:Short chain dehydrogenase [Phytophthora megakarya]|uniref:Short chain dehydrogenase n=1 Tax=Phytophthora megakarya TaxID=4795 RepID=A0A225W2B7_9STRA|nr:Short chain dehydrogenase [Phytophthora megakarya]